MDTKTYLGQISRLNNEINKKIEKIYELRLNAMCTPGFTSGERVQTSSCEDRIGNVISKIIEEEKNADKMIDELFDLKEKIRRQISKVKSEKHKHILTEKYIMCKSNTEISKEMGMTKRGYIYAKKRAVEEFEKENEQYIV